MTKVMNIPYTPSVPPKIAFRNSLIDICIQIYQVSNLIFCIAVKIKFQL